MPDYIEIPPQRLEQDILQAVIEEFITREGTDYGHQEFTLAQKVAQVMRQLERREVLLVFDPDSESCTLIHRDAG